MKQLMFENLYSKERFLAPKKQETKFIDGVEFIKLIKTETNREVLVRKDSLKKVNI